MNPANEFKSFKSQEETFKENLNETVMNEMINRIENDFDIYWQTTPEHARLTNRTDELIIKEFAKRFWLEGGIYQLQKAIAVIGTQTKPEENDKNMTYKVKL